MKKKIGLLMLALSLGTSAIYSAPPSSVNPRTPPSWCYNQGYGSTPHPNYTVGTAIGGAIGTFCGPLGTIVGTLVGGLIGSATKKSEDARWSQRQTLDEIYVDWMIRHYDVKRHQEYVDCIAQSCLPKEWKTRVIYHFDTLLEDAQMQSNGQTSAN